MKDFTFCAPTRAIFGRDTELTVGRELKAAGATRVMPPCMGMGQAAGAAAALALNSNVSMQDVNIHELQQALREQNVYLG